MLAVLACLTAACGTFDGAVPTPEELELADHGPPPVNIEGYVQRDVEKRYGGITHVQVGSPVEAWFGNVGGLTQQRDIRFGWAVRFRAYTISATALRKLAVDGAYFFRDGFLEGIADRDGFRFVE